LILNRLLPTEASFSNATPEEQSWVIAKEFGICNGWRLNFVLDQQGRTSGSDGSSDGVSNALDRLVLGKLRSQADLIVTSGETARVERYKSSRHAPIAIITRTGDLDRVPAVQGTQYYTPLVITDDSHFGSLEAALSDVDAKILSFGLDSMDNKWPIQVAAVVTGEGFQSPILEAGLSMAHQFLSAGVLSEICLTVTKRAGEAFSARAITPEALARLFGPGHHFELVAMFTSREAIFTRWLTT
jgi:riboflavin biosynthesis pyrimidine reductase